MGVIGRPHGVRGLVRVTSYADDLTAYGPLSDAQGRRYVLHSRGEGVAEIAEVVGGAEVKVADRAAAEKLTNTRLYVDRAQLPEPEDGEFYLADLIGLAAVDVGGMVLGTVGAVHDYGAGASLGNRMRGKATAAGAVYAGQRADGGSCRAAGRGRTARGSGAASRYFSSLCGRGVGRGGRTGIAPSP